MSTLKTKCKGRIESDPCPEEVTYKRDPLPGILLKEMPVEKDVYLTCRRGHTCKYSVTKTGMT